MLTVLSLTTLLTLSKSDGCDQRPVTVTIRPIGPTTIQGIEGQYQYTCGVSEDYCEDKSDGYYPLVPNYYAVCEDGKSYCVMTSAAIPTPGQVPKIPVNYVQAGPFGGLSGLNQGPGIPSYGGFVGGQRPYAIPTPGAIPNLPVNPGQAAFGGFSGENMGPGVTQSYGGFTGQQSNLPGYGGIGIGGGFSGSPGQIIQSYGGEFTGIRPEGYSYGPGPEGGFSGSKDQITESVGGFTGIGSIVGEKGPTLTGYGLPPQQATNGQGTGYGPGPEAGFSGSKDQITQYGGFTGIGSIVGEKGPTLTGYGLPPQGLTPKPEPTPALISRGNGI